MCVLQGPRRQGRECSGWAASLCLSCFFTANSSSGARRWLLLSFGFGGCFFFLFFFFGFSTQEAWVPKDGASVRHPRTLACQPCNSDQMHQLRGSHQASIFGHAVEKTSLLQEVGGPAALPDLSLVQDDDPARRGDTDVRRREGVCILCPQRATRTNPCFGSGPSHLLGLLL